MLQVYRSLVRPASFVDARGTLPLRRGRAPDQHHLTASGPWALPTAIERRRPDNQVAQQQIILVVGDEAQTEIGFRDFSRPALSR